LSKSIIIFMENPVAFLHIAGRFNREIWRYLRYFVNH
jgi:hypothetical protein